MSLTRSTVQMIGIAAAALTAAALAVANFGGGGDDGGTGPYIVTLAVCIGIAVVLFGWAIPRTTHPARAGLIVGALGLLSLPVFWSGLPYVLGPAAIVFGLLGRTREGSGGAATAAIVVGALATTAGVLALVADQLS
ncbi:MAG TPA: hypothetical protein VFP31_12545 [Gaiellaceae bacterium]|nr:hypothetical protein [Gaiellaceae bacterium]